MAHRYTDCYIGELATPAYNDRLESQTNNAMNVPTFSVVIPTYNRRDLIPYAVESVLRQTFGDLEVVISDNGSTDDTALVIGRITDPRVHYVRTPVHGPIAYSWEFARSHAKGRLVMMLSDDDALVPDALQRFIDTSRRHDADFVFCKVAEYRDDHFPGADRNVLSSPAFTEGVHVVSAEEFIAPLFAFRRRFEMHPSAFVFAKRLADTIAARCGRFFQTNGVEYSAWPMAAALATARVQIDAPLVVLGRTAKSWGSNLNLANPGKERIEAFIADVEHEYRYAPLRNFTTANMWAEGILTAKKLLPEELAEYEFDEAQYLRATIAELQRRSAQGVDVSRELDEVRQYTRQNPGLQVNVGAPRHAGTTAWRLVRSAIAYTGVRGVRRRIRAMRNAQAIRSGRAHLGFTVSGERFGFRNAFEAAAFLARVAFRTPGNAPAAASRA